MALQCVITNSVTEKDCESQVWHHGRLALSCILIVERLSVKSVSETTFGAAVLFGD
jgi:hypothetical protein